MRLVIDMNLSTDWVTYLQGLGHDAIHWSSVGPQDAPDEAIARMEDELVTGALVTVETGRLRLRSLADD